MTSQQGLRVITEADYRSLGEKIAKSLGSGNGLHQYFETAFPRLYSSCKTFGLIDGRRLGRVLEVGPFYSYLPFLLRDRAESYTVIEGHEPAVDPLLTLYQEVGIAIHPLDFFEIFGPTHAANHRLPFADAAFDEVICWETMEHFNFNPVKFVRELYRVCAPGAHVHITVPNKASFQALLSLFLARPDPPAIDSYFQFENYQSAGKTAFYGFHWREYAPEELSSLFLRVGFKVEKCLVQTMFHHRKDISLRRKILRALNKLAVLALPRYGTNVLLTANKLKI